MSKKEIRECEKILKALSESFNPMICAQQLAILASQTFPLRFQEGGIAPGLFNSDFELITVKAEEKIIPEDIIKKIIKNNDKLLSITVKLNNKQIKVLKRLKKRNQKYPEEKK